jgi:hypothetical protein
MIFKFSVSQRQQLLPHLPRTDPTNFLQVPANFLHCRDVIGARSVRLG